MQSTDERAEEHKPEQKSHESRLVNLKSKKLVFGQKETRKNHAGSADTSNIDKEKGDRLALRALIVPHQRVRGKLLCFLVGLWQHTLRIFGSL
eukprot:1155040-Pelagomonas_calceolata.AAC.1